MIAVGGSAINNWISPKTLKETPLTSTYFTKDWLENEDVDRGHRKRGKDAFQNVIELNQPYLVGKTKYRWMCEPGFLFEAGIADYENDNKVFNKVVDMVNQDYLPGISHESLL